MSNCQNVLKYLNQYLDDALAPEIRKTVNEHLAGCVACRGYFTSENSLEKKLTGMLRNPVANEKDIWNQAIESILSAGSKQRPAACPPDGAVSRAPRPFVLKYLIPLASAAVILLALLPLLLFPPSATPEIVKIAAREHQSFLDNQTKFDVISDSPEEITGYFREKCGFSVGDCGCAILQKDELKLKGGRMLEVQKASIAAINAAYQNTPVTVIILPESYLPDFPKTQKCVKKCHNINDAKIQDFNYALMRVENQIICVISKINTDTLKKMLQDTREKRSCGCGHQ